MTRIDSVRAATDSAKESVQHAAEVVAPYAETAKDQAARYAHEARTRLAPKASKAAQQARVQYDAYLAPHIELARSHVPPKVDEAAQRAALRTRQATKYAAEYTVPRVGSAVAAAQPVAEEATSRSIAALAALRGQVTPKEIQQLARRNRRRAKAGRALKGFAVASLLAVAPMPPGGGGTSRPTRTGWSNPRPHGGLRPRTVDLGRRQRPDGPRPRGPGQAGRHRPRRDGRGGRN